MGSYTPCTESCATSPKPVVSNMRVSYYIARVLATIGVGRSTGALFELDSPTVRKVVGTRESCKVLQATLLCGQNTSQLLHCLIVPTQQHNRSYIC
jgi:hypothetical protein